MQYYLVMARKSSPRNLCFSYDFSSLHVKDARTNVPPVDWREERGETFEGAWLTRNKESVVRLVNNIIKFYGDVWDIYFEEELTKKRYKDLEVFSYIGAYQQLIDFSPT